MVFQNIPILHGAIFKHPLDNPRSVPVYVEVSGINVPKQMLIQTVKIGCLFHLSGIDSAKIRIFFLRYPKFLYFCPCQSERKRVDEESAFFALFR